MSKPKFKSILPCLLKNLLGTFLIFFSLCIVPHALAADPKPDPKAVEWANKNPWFKEMGEMRDFAFQVHDDLVRQGGAIGDDAYYQAIESAVRSKFPDYFKDSRSAKHDSSIELLNNYLQEMGSATATLETIEVNGVFEMAKRGCKKEGVYEMRSKKNKQSFGTLLCHKGTAKVWRGSPGNIQELSFDWSYVSGGKANGSLKSYSSDGRVNTEWGFVNGEHDGVDRTYDPSGELMSESAYKKGIQHGLRRIYSKGNVSMEFEYDSGKKVSHKSFFDNGKTVYECKIRYEKELQIETCSWFDGTSTTSTYLNDKKHGKSRTFSEAGQLVSERIYNQGQFIQGNHKQMWFHGTKDQPIYFDSIEVIKDGVCVHRAAATGKELGTYMIEKGRCE